MSRRFNVPPYIPVDSQGFVPYGDIRAGMTPANVGGMWRDMARNINLAYSTGRAQAICNINYFDGQGAVNSNVATFVDFGRIRFPRISGQHIVIRAEVYAVDLSGGTKKGHFRILTTNGVDVGDTVEISSVTGAWYPVYGAYFGNQDILVGFNSGYETLTFKTDGNFKLLTIAIEYKIVQYGTTWPTGADGKLSTTIDGDFIPLDDADFTKDAPLSSAAIQQLVDDIDTLDTRKRMVLCTTHPDPLAQYTRRAIIPVEYNGTELTLWFYCNNNSVSPANIYLQVGGGVKTLEELAAEGGLNVTAFEVAGSFGPGWTSTTITLPDVREPLVNAPRGYPGFNQISIVASSDIDLYSVCVWG